MIYLFIIATLISLVVNFRHAVQLPTEAEVSQILKGDLRYSRSLLSLFGSMCVGMLIMGIAAYFAIADTTSSDTTLVVGLLVYYPIYYWISALVYCEFVALVLERHFQVDDRKLRPKLFAITRDRARRVHAIMAVLFSLLLIGKTDLPGAWAIALNVIAVLGWLAWIPVNFFYFKATAKAVEYMYPDQNNLASTASMVIIGFGFHMGLGLFVPLLVFVAPFLLPKILRRDRDLALS